MIAIVSDIHSNLEALEAVLEDIDRYDTEAIYCLGDTVGYGPNPRECVSLAMDWRLVLLGNHDHAVLYEPKDFNPIAEEATRWTRRQIETPIPNQESVDRRWEFIAELPMGHSEDNILFVHGSPRQPLNEYVFPPDVRNRNKMERLFELVEKFCFLGHTHVPGIFTESLDFIYPTEDASSHVIVEGKVMCNVGSVGQPRDGDWRACYVLFDGEAIHYRRVEYDVATTVKKIHNVPELDRFLGDRLLTGK